MQTRFLSLFAALVLLTPLLSGHPHEDIVVPAVLTTGLSFVAERETIAFNALGTEFVIINSGDLITTNNEISFGKMSDFSDEKSLKIFFGEPDNQFAAPAKNFRPAYSEDLFGEHLLIAGGVAAGEDTADSDTAIAMWVPVQYREVLLGRNRYILPLLFPAIENFTHYDYVLYDYVLWHQTRQAGIEYGRAVFYNSAIRLGTSTHIGIRNITRTESGYTVSGVLSILDSPYDDQWGFLAGSEFLQVYRAGSEITLSLHLDGDYLDMYAIDSGIKIGTFIRARPDFITQYENLIRFNVGDLASVTWPRREDGSVHFPPLQDIPASRPSHRAQAFLNIRENPSLISRIITTAPEGTQMQLLEIGHSTAIGITIAPWVKVLTDSGYVGWCFSGFLEIIPHVLLITEEPDDETAFGLSPSVLTRENIAFLVESYTDTPGIIAPGTVQPMPLWALISGITAAVSGIWLIAIRRRLAKR